MNLLGQMMSFGEYRRQSRLLKTYLFITSYAVQCELVNIDTEIRVGRDSSYIGSVVYSTKLIPFSSVAEVHSPGARGSQKALSCNVLRGAGDQARHSLNPPVTFTHIQVKFTDFGSKFTFDADRR